MIASAGSSKDRNHVMASPDAQRHFAPRAWQPPSAIQGVLALLGLCGFGLVLLSTSRYGVGTFPDAEHYLGAARSLLAGQGYRYYHGSPYTGWPPLFPTLLAALGLTGVDPQVGARWLNALAFGLIVFVSGQLFLRCTASKALALLGTLSILASAPLLDSSVMAASEPVFILLVLLFVLGMPRWLHGGKWPDLLLVSLVAGLACLQRYAGVSLILAGVILIGCSPARAPAFARLKALAFFGLLATAPLALWCLRNRLVAGEVVGVHRFHLPSDPQFLGALRAATHVVGTWLLPWMPANSIRLLLVGAVVILAGIMIVLSHVAGFGRHPSLRRPAVERDERQTRALQLWSVLVVGLVYFGFVVICGAGLSWRPGPRLLVPIYPLVMALMVAGIDGARRLLFLFPVPGAYKKLVPGAGIVLCALWLWSPFHTLYRNTAQRLREGAGGFSTAAWHHSPLVQWLREHPLPGRVYSNGSDAIYLLTGMVTSLTPPVRYEQAPAAFARANSPEACYLVWFDGLQRTWLYDLRELLSWCRVEEMAALPDGRVYRFLGAGGPGVSAVYRFWSAKLGRHLYTIRKAERNRLFNEDDGTWSSYEGAAFYAFAPDGPRPPEVRPIYQLRSAGLGTCFYTMDEGEKDRLLQRASGDWTCAGVAFYAWPQAGPKDVLPVYRFWSERQGDHLYTINEREKARLRDEFPQTWTYEGVAWYTYGP